MENNLNETELQAADSMTTQERMRSWVVWSSCIGALWIILNAFGLPQKWGMTNETFETVLNALGVIMTGFGILNNPTDPNHF